MNLHLTRCLKSSSLLLLPCLIGLNLAFAWACESTSLGLEINGPSERLFVLKTLDNFVRQRQASKEEKGNDIFILSSSLGITSAAMTDSKVYGYPKLNTIDYMHYSGFRYLDEQVKKRTGVEVHTVNLSNSAIMICEQLLMLKELVRVGIKPKLVVLEIAPRDFLDHWTAAYNRSRLAQILIMRQTPLAWQIGKSVASNVDVFSSKLWPFYCQRVEMKDYLVRIACETFGRPATLFQAQVMQRMGIKLTSAAHTKPVATDINKVALTTAPKTNESSKGENTNISKIVDAPPSRKTLEFSISDYKGRYLPLDRERWGQELKAFDEFLSFASDNDVPLMVVAMPLTKTNRELLPLEFLSEHRQRINGLFANYPSFAFCDLLDSDCFGIDDFVDTVHLRSSGGEKLADTLSSRCKALRGWN